MSLIRSVTVFLLAAVIALGIPGALEARVMMTGMVNQFMFSVMPTADFSIDEWLNNPNLWNVVISNSAEQSLTVLSMDMDFTIGSREYPELTNGVVRVVDSSNPSRALKDKLLPGETFVINNTMVREGRNYIDAGSWSDNFVKAAIHAGYLPEGQYSMVFVLRGRYSNGETFSGYSDDMLREEVYIEIRNPSPPELVTPMDGSDNEVAIPRFTWQRPAVNDFGRFGSVQVSYDLKLWKMFDETGASIPEEVAIVRIPIWEVRGLPTEGVDFNPNDSREELLGGRTYCWQVQAFDGEGRYITETKQGKSEVWEFTIDFTPPELNEPTMYMPFSITWEPARAGGLPIFYRVRLADNPEYTDPYEMRNLMITRFTYPMEEPPLRYGVMYYLEVQATDETQIPLGAPAQTSFQLPPLIATLASPADGSALVGMNPIFSWTGNTRYYVLTIFDEASDWVFISSSISGTRYMYNGEPLAGGTTYAWNVTPANQYGDPVGEPSATWRFTTPGTNQIALVSPISEGIDTVFPIFTWTLPADAPEGISSTIRITTGDGVDIHTGTSSENQYEYPRDATLLEYGGRYNWSVTTTEPGVEPSGEAWFFTPFVTPEGEVITMEDISNALRIVMGDAPEFSEFENKILAAISDESGPITPTTLLEILNLYRLVKVTIE